MDRPTPSTIRDALDGRVIGSPMDFKSPYPDIEPSPEAVTPLGPGAVVDKGFEAAW